MVRLFVVLVALLVSSPGFAQPPVRITPTWNVAWRSMTASDGSVTQVPVFYWAEPEAPAVGQRYSAPPEIGVVVRVDDRLRAAQRAKNAGELERMLSDQFSETDTDGVERNKTAALQFLAPSDTPEWNLGRMTARAAGTAVVLTGEEIGQAQARRHFTRVYIRESNGEWKLLSSAVVSTSIPSPR